MGGLPDGAPEAWRAAAALVPVDKRQGYVVQLELLGVLPPRDRDHVDRVAFQRGSYGLASVCLRWWARAVKSLGCSAPTRGEDRVLVPYMVMRPGYAWGKLQCVAGVVPHS